MNELIRELAEQAGITPGVMGLNRYTHFDPEKFARLIVQECAGVGYDAAYYECALNVSNKILEHFGVEQ